MDERLLKELLSLGHECEYLEFKKDNAAPDEIGEYISAISNACALLERDEGYLIWGIDDATHQPVGTSFDPEENVRGEPFKHYLSRLLEPRISIRFEEVQYEGKRLVSLTIPAAKRLPTSYSKERFIRIGSSKERLSRYPEYEGDLWIALRQEPITIINQEAPRQDLTFSQFLLYYQTHGLPLKAETFVEERSFLVPSSGKYNVMAYLFSDQNDLTFRVSMFAGDEKSSRLISLNDYGRKCLLATVNDLFEFGKVLNLTKIDESKPSLERKEEASFDMACYREAILNACIHNDWNELNSPMISIFSNRIEILSNGGLPKNQTLEGFYMGQSRPRCRELAEIFIQLRLLERSGRGVRKIIDTYGRKAYEVGEGFVLATIPLALRQKPAKGKPSSAEKAIMKAIRKNPYVTTFDLMYATGLCKTSVQGYLSKMRGEGMIAREGARKNGYWAVLV